MLKVNSIVPQVRITSDDMTAYLLLPATEEKYTLQDLQEALAQKAITHGIDVTILEKMIENDIYEQEVQVANGTLPQEGTDGYYEYNFNQNLSQKPKVRPDGSVDYWSIDRVEAVTKGQLIATYYPAIQGLEGATVKGRPLTAKRARELGPLKGKGFTRAEDSLTYTASIDGKIEVTNGRVMIIPTYEIVGNADVSVGHIDFHGDVIIHGNVCSGVSIKATGSITIDGIVETSQLWAGKDIILRGGMMGDSKGSVFTKGSITAKFFEYTTVEAWEDIQADVFLNCDVICKKRIVMNGKKACIVGGSISAIQGIEVFDLGNDAQMKTMIQVGNKAEVFRRIKILQRKILAARDMLDKLEKGLRDFERLEQKREIKLKDDPRKIQLLRIKIRDTALLCADQTELELLEKQVEDAKEAGVRVLGHIYPGVMVNMDDLKLPIWTKQEKVEFVKSFDKIVMSEVLA